MGNTFVLTLLLAAAVGFAHGAAQSHEASSHSTPLAQRELASSDHYIDKLDIGEMCAEAIRAQENSCRNLCSGTGGYVFDSGICGVGAKCTCEVTVDRPPN